MQTTNSGGPVRQRRVIVVAGGAPIDPATVADLPGDALVIAADSGADRAIELAWPVAAVIGDLDSVTEPALRELRSTGVDIRQHPAAKDETDLELALGLALEVGATHVVVVGLAGSRFDHVLANALVLTAPALATVEVEGRFGEAVVRVVRRHLELTGSPGQLLSLLPANGPVHGIVTEGLRYPLRGETLEPGSPRGISNELVADRASVSLRTGVLLAVSPSSSHPPAHVVETEPGEP